ncbi:MAG: hypothetical protein WCS69_04375 [Ignavibacteriaceae bacterium]|jgi:hypothetical protein
MANSITGNHDGENGRNESYHIPGRGDVPRKKLVREVEEDKHPKFSIYKINREKFVRGKPDDSEKNNINK